MTSNLNATVIMIAEKAADLVAGKTVLPPELHPKWSHPDWQTQQR